MLTLKYSKVSIRYLFYYMAVKCACVKSCLKRCIENVFNFLLYEITEMLQSLAQRPAPANTNRERRPRYQHPKGAPNADLIFKTGGR